MSVKNISNGNRPVLIIPLPKKGSVPPTLIKVNASILVAMAIRGLTPNSSMTGTVMREVLPAIVLIMLAIKKITARISIEPTLIK